MPGYIDADALKNKLISSGAICDFGLYLIDIQPAADVRPERHGEWITRHDGLPFCSECNYNGLGYIAVDLGYCPNCGAKMDGKDGDSG